MLPPLSQERAQPHGLLLGQDLDLDCLPSARGLLAKYGWRMCDHFREYSEGESAWSDNMPSSCNEAHLPPERRMRARKGRRGSEHPLVKKRMKR